MKKFLIGLMISLSLALTSVGVFAATPQDGPQPAATCSVDVPYGYPTDSKKDVTTICRRAYVLQHDNVAKIPVWVAYVLTKKEAEGCVARSDAFAADQSLPAGKRAEKADYLNSGYDKGHIANNADMAFDQKVDDESFLLSNMAPQIHPFNAGVWLELEENVRGWAFARQHPLLIYAGPVYGSTDKTIGPNKVVVPHGFYKIVIDTVTKEELDFEFPHKEASIKTDMKPYLTSRGAIEKDTGITFPAPGDKNSIAKAVWPDSVSAYMADKKAVCKGS